MTVPATIFLPPPAPTLILPRMRGREDREAGGWGLAAPRFLPRGA